MYQLLPTNIYLNTKYFLLNFYKMNEFNESFELAWSSQILLNPNPIHRLGGKIILERQIN